MLTSCLVFDFYWEWVLAWELAKALVIGILLDLVSIRIEHFELLFLCVHIEGVVEEPVPREFRIRDTAHGLDGISLGRRRS